jgi:hypothetical protein
MTIEENILKNLAYKYFQGELEAKDEKTLYDFIQTTYGQQRLRQLATVRLPAAWSTRA